MQEDQRHGIAASAPLMNEMDAQTVDLRSEMGELVDGLFLRSPIEFRAPIVDQLAHVRQIGAVVPGGALHFVRPASACKTSLEVIQDCLGNLHRKRIDLAHDFIMNP